MWVYSVPLLNWAIWGTALDFTSSTILSGESNRNMAATAVLISTDPALGECLRKAVTHLGILHLDLHASVDEALSATDDRLAIVFFHYAAGQELQLAKLLQFKQTHPAHPAVVAITDDFHPAQASSLLKQGVADCLTWPLDVPRLAMLTDFLIWRSHCSPTPNTATAKPTSTRPPRVEPLVRWPNDVAQRMELLAAQDSTVLVVGETGTGRTQAARELHTRSPRSDEPLVVVECSSLSPTLLGSEQHGHLMGSSPGVEHHMANRLQAAGAGTLLLEDIDLLPLKLQEYLLGTIEQRFIQFHDSSRLVPLRSRIIATSHRGLESKRRIGQFRNDLFYHLNAVKLNLPSLTEHRELIAPAVEQCIAQACARNGRPLPQVDQLAMRAIVAYGWPSNLRELRNVVERAVALSNNGTILLENLPAVVAKSLSLPRTARKKRVGTNLESSRQNAEMLAISQALAKNGNNRSKTAAELGISRVTLYKKLHKYGFIQLPDGTG